MGEPVTLPPPPPSGRPCHWENFRLVTDWRWEAVTVFGGWRIGKRRWVRGRDGWDEEEGEWAHEVPFEDKARAEAIAAELERGAQAG